LKELAHVVVRTSPWQKDRIVKIKVKKWIVLTVVSGKELEGKRIKIS
jgi:hypothetical protein